MVCFITGSKNDGSQDSILQMVAQLICVQKYIELHIETRLYTSPTILMKEMARVLDESLQGHVVDNSRLA